MTNDTLHMTDEKWQVTCDTWHSTPDIWHLTCDIGTPGMGNIMWKLQVSSSVWERLKSDMWHMTGGFLVHHISPGIYKTIWLVSMCSIINKHTYFLLNLDLHCNLPHFRNVSNTSEESTGVQLQELVPKKNLSVVYVGNIEFCPLTPTLREGLNKKRTTKDGLVGKSG